MGKVPAPILGLSDSLVPEFPFNVRNGLGGDLVESCALDYVASLLVGGISVISQQKTLSMGALVYGQKVVCNFAALDPSASAIQHTYGSPP